MRRPAFQFYPSDWRKDSALQSCSISARGLWIELLCVMHECDPYGCLVINGAPASPSQISRLVGEQEKAVRALLSELESAGVFSRTPEGAIYSRRMVKDERIRDIRGGAGRLGGNPNLVKQKPNQSPNQSPNQGANIGPTPSSSSSSSSSTSPIGDVSPPAPSPSDRVRGEEQKRKQASIDIPDWLPPAAWSEFVQHRKTIGAPMSPLAQTKAMAELGRLRDLGNDPEAVISKSIVQGWKGVFPLDNGHSPRAGPQSRPEKFDPVAYVNRNRKSSENSTANIIDITAERLA